MSYKTITREELKVGDEVQIANGDWFKFIDAFIGNIDEKTWKLENEYSILFTDSENPILTVFRRKVESVEISEEWLSINECFQSSSNWEFLNKTLTNKYGSPPIVNTYNGEPAEQFGIIDSTPIHRWNSGLYAWADTMYMYLQKGDRWMLQPPPPK